jgi:hypothetical protein
MIRAANEIRTIVYAKSERQAPLCRHYASGGGGNHGFARIAVLRDQVTGAARQHEVIDFTARLSTGAQYAIAS